MAQITVVNAHWNNRGDEAAHRPLWLELQKRYPGCKITVLFKDKNLITWFPDIPGINYESCQFKASAWDIWHSVLSEGLIGKDPKLKMMVRLLKNSDLIVYPPGGSVINDRFFWSKQLEYLTPFLCAHIFQVPMVVCAPSMGPYDSDSPQPTRQWLLRVPRLFCVREDTSRKYLETIAITDNVHVTMDLAFMDDVDTEDAERQLVTYSELNNFLAAYPRVVGMTISDFKWHVKHGKDAELLERIETTARQMIGSLTERGYGVLLIPQLFGNQNDYDYLQSFVSEGVHVMSDEPDTYAQQYVISKLYALIGMRYHSNIFAAKMGTPFVAIVYEEKMEGFLELAGLGDYGLALNELSFEALNEKFHALEVLYDELRNCLKQGLQEWRQRARRTVDLLPDIL
ncbi:MAG: polysaccharide pyruvyl transferase family protein [Chlorobium sp.]